ncbi:unnamed protein product [Alternaria alternata]
MNDVIYQEINLVIRARVAELGKNLKLPETTKQELEEKLLRMKHRTYLWLYLAIQGIETVYADSLRPEEESIDSLPSSVEHAYVKILERVRPEQEESAKKILQIVVGARRPLTTRELANALEVTMEPDRLKEKIRRLCGLFIFFNDSKAYLIHQTAKEFLVGSSITGNPRWKHCFSPTETERLMAQICISYLVANDLDKGATNETHARHSSALSKSNQFDLEDPAIEEYKMKHSLLGYSANHWISHVQMGNIVDSGLIVSVAELCNIGDASSCIWFRVYSASTNRSELWRNSRLQRPKTGLHWAVELGVVVAARRHLDANDSASRNIEDIGAVFLAAIENRSFGGTLTALLLDFIDDSIKITQEVVIAAAKNWGNGRKVMTLLLDRRAADVQITQEVVVAAAGNGGNGKDIMTLLLDRRAADVQITQEAVIAAAGNQLLETVSTLQGQDSFGGSQSETLVHEGSVLNHEKDDLSDDDDPLETSSVSSHITTAREKDAKAHVAYVLANDTELRALCSRVVNVLGKAEFANEGRKLLKSFYCGLLMDARTQLEKQSVSLLKSRNGRIRISSNIAEIISSPDVEHSEAEKRAEEQIRMRRERLEIWAEDYTHTSHADEDSHEWDAVQLRLVEKVNGQPEDFEHADSGTSHSGDSVEGFDLEGETKENFMKKVTEMENFFRNSRSFEVLLDGFRELLLPQSLRDILPATSVEISTEEDKSISNQMKSLVEDFTMLDWDWWPLTPRMRALNPNEKRLIWKCSCGTRLWKEISAKEANVVSLLLPSLETESLSMPQCTKFSADLPLWRRLADDIKYSFSTLTGGQQRTSPTALGSTTTTTTTTGVQATTTGQTSANPQTPAQIPQPFPANQQLISVSGSGSPPSLRWIIFGTQPYNKTAELEHIEIDDFTNDSRFFRSLRDHYRKHRGLLSRWLSIWRIGACDGFDRVASDLVFLENPELPTDFVEYIYNPRAPPNGNAENPLISRHKASMFMNCNDPCRWRFFHNCVPHLINRRVIDRVPRKKSKFAIRDDNSMEHQAWGITVRHEISVAYVVCYHVLILALPFAFWGWWQHNHPDDLQNAAVPITVVAGLLSLFWGANGILTEGRHSGSKTG